MGRSSHRVGGTASKVAGRAEPAMERRESGRCGKSAPPDAALNISSVRAAGSSGTSEATHFGPNQDNS